MVPRLHPRAASSLDSLFAVPDAERRAALEAAEARAQQMLTAIETAGLVRARVSEREIEDEIKVLAFEQFGVKTHWHRRIVRSGPNSITIADDHPPVRMIETGDIVYLDLGPVFEGWEADIGKSYALGDDPRKTALVAELPRQFDLLQQHFRANPDITGAALYNFAKTSAQDAGWTFGGKIAGHIVSEFAHGQIPGAKHLNRISPLNPEPMSNPDGNGNPRHWIGEIHLVEKDGSFGGFYERLL
jgi:Xaa-Pro dipeptidase